MAKPQELIPADEPRAVITPPSMIAEAVRQGASIEVLEKLMGLQERWEAAQARKAFEAAITEAKAELPTITRNKTVSFGQGKTAYRHETLDHIVDAIQPVLQKHGLSFRFRTDVQDGKVIVTCRIAHRDGHHEETSLPGPADTSGSKNAIQAIGSTVTYLQRYTLKAALGLAASDDDDGPGAGAAPRSAPEEITPDHLAELRKLIDKVEADEAKFCGFLAIRNLAALPERRFQEARHELVEFGKRNGVVIP